MEIFVLVAGLGNARQTDSICKKKYVWFTISCIQVSEVKDFQIAFAPFLHLVVEIVGFIAPLSFILKGWLTIHFNSNFMEKKKGETFSTDKWF